MLYHSSEKAAEADRAAEHQLEPGDRPDAPLAAVRRGGHPLVGQEPQEELRHSQKEANVSEH